MWRLDHIACHVGPADHPGDARAPLARADQHEVAHLGAAAARGVHGHLAAALEGGLGDEEAALLREHTDTRRLAAADAGQAVLIVTLRASASRATGSASSRSVRGLSTARTVGLIPLFEMFSPLGR